MQKTKTRSNGNNQASSTIQLTLSDAARLQAGVFGFLANLLNQRPDLELVRTLRTSGLDGLARMVEETEPQADIALGMREMARFVEETAGLPEAEVETMLAVDWTRLFRGVSPAYSPPPPYEGVYTPAAGAGLETLQSVNRFYLDCGLAIEDDYPNRLDYLGLELSFLSSLAEAEAQAWETGDEEAALAYQQKARTFFREHLGLWVDKFLDAAQGFAETAFYVGFLQLSRGFMEQIGGDV